MAIQVYGLTTDAWSSTAADALVASKQVHGYQWNYGQDGTIAADIAYAGPMKANAVLVSFEAAITETIATGGDRTVTVDLKKSTGAGAFGTVLSATISFTSASVLRTVSSATLSTTSMVDNDFLSINVTVAGAAGAQAAGLVVRVVWYEAWV